MALLLEGSADNISLPRLSPRRATAGPAACHRRTTTGRLARGVRWPVSGPPPTTSTPAVTAPSDIELKKIFRASLSAGARRVPGGSAVARGWLATGPLYRLTWARTDEWLGAGLVPSRA